MSRHVDFISPDQAGEMLLGRTVATSVQPVSHPLQFSLGKAYPSSDGAFNIIPWRLFMDDTRGGLNYDIGPLETYYQRVKKSSLYTGHYRTVCLPLLTTNATTPDPTTPLFMSSCNFLGQAVVGIAAASNASLFAETSTTNPVIVAKTYSPGSIINAVASAVINGTRSLLVMREGGVIQVLSDLASTPTVAGSMHADTTQAYGVIQVPQFMSPEMRLLIYAGGKIRMLRGTDAIAREPDDMWSNVPNYGYALGMATLQTANSIDNRAFWVWPKSTSLAAHMLTKGSESPGRIVHTDEFGRNPTELDMKLPFVYYAALVNGGIVASDGQKVVFHNGTNADVILDNNYRGFDSDSQVRIRGFYVREPSLYIEEEIQASSSGSAATVRHILRYDFETASWHQVSGDTTLSTTGAFGFASATGSLPVGSSTGYLQTYSDGSWRRKYEPPYGANPFSVREVDPGGTGNAQSYENSGTITWPNLQMGGVEVWPKVIRRFQYLGDVDTGGAGAKVAFTLPGVSPTVDFTALINQASRIRTFAPNNSRFQDLTITATVTGSGTATKTPNVMPFVVEGLAFQPSDADELRDTRPRRWAP